MKSRTILREINRHAAIYVCLAVFFAFCWFIHFAAYLKMGACNRQFAVMNDETLRAMALIDWITVHFWLAIAYVLLVIASVAFLQIRGRRPWTHWVAALSLCGPCLLYWSACMYCATVLAAR